MKHLLFGILLFNSMLSIAFGQLEDDGHAGHSHPPREGQNSQTPAALAGEAPPITENSSRVGNMLARLAQEGDETTPDPDVEVPITTNPYRGVGSEGAAFAFRNPDPTLNTDGTTRENSDGDDLKNIEWASTCCDESNIVCQQIGACNLFVNSVLQEDAENSTFQLASHISLGNGIILDGAIWQNFMLNLRKSNSCEQCLGNAFNSVHNKEDENEAFSENIIAYRSLIKEKVIRVRTNRAFQSFHALNNALYGYYALNARELDALVASGSVAKEDFLCSDPQLLISKLKSTDASSSCGQLKSQLGDRFEDTINNRVGEYLHTLPYSQHGIGDFDNFEEAIETFINTFDRDPTFEGPQCTSRARHAQVLAGMFYEESHAPKINFLFSILDESTSFAGAQGAQAIKQNYCSRDEVVAPPSEILLANLLPSAEGEAGFVEAIFNNPRYSNLKEFIEASEMEVSAQNFAGFFNVFLEFAQKFEPGLALVLNDKDLYCSSIIEPLSAGSSIQFRNSINLSASRGEDDYRSRVGNLIQTAAKCELEYENIANQLCTSANDINRVSPAELAAAQNLDAHHGLADFQAPNLSPRRSQLLASSLQCSMGDKELTIEERLLISRTNSLARLRQQMDSGEDSEEGESEENFEMANIEYEYFARNSFNPLTNQCSTLANLGSAAKYFEAMGLSPVEAMAEARYESGSMKIANETDEGDITDTSVAQARNNHSAGEAAWRTRSGLQRVGRRLRRISATPLGLEGGEELSESTVTGSENTPLSDVATGSASTEEIIYEAERDLGQATTNFQRARQNVLDSSSNTEEVFKKAESDPQFAEAIDKLDNEIVAATGKTPDEVARERSALMAGQPSSLSADLADAERADLLAQIDLLRAQIQEKNNAGLTEELAEATAELREARETIDELRRRDSQVASSAPRSRGNVSVGARDTRSLEGSSSPRSVNPAVASVATSRSPASVPTPEPALEFENEYAARQIVRVRTNILKEAVTQSAAGQLIITFEGGPDLGLSAKGKEDYVSMERPIIVYDPANPSEISEVIFNGDTSFRIPFNQLRENYQLAVRRYIAANPDKKIVGNGAEVAILPSPEQLSQISDLTHQHIRSDDEDKGSLYLELLGALDPNQGSR